MKLMQSFRRISEELAILTQLVSEVSLGVTGDIRKKIRGNNAKSIRMKKMVLAISSPLPIRAHTSSCLFIHFK